MGEQRRGPMDIFDAVADVRLHCDDEWRERAACRTADPELFFADEHDQAALNSAKAICAECDVQGPCHALWATLPPGERQHGVWFGTSPRDRRRADRRRRRQLPVAS